MQCFGCWWFAFDLFADLRDLWVGILGGLFLVWVCWVLICVLGSWVCICLLFVFFVGFA